MRWPFRRERGKSPAPSPVSTGDGQADGTVDAAPARRSPPVPRPSGRQWLTLPPLPVTVRPAAPLVSGPAPVVPPLPGRRRVSGPDVAPATGRVEGLAAVVPHVPEPAPLPVAPLPEPDRPLVHRRRVRSGPPVERPTMVEATGGFVGEAREPAVPHRAPGWMRYVPEWLSQSTQSEPEPARPAARPKPVLPPSKIVERPTTSPSVTPTVTPSVVPTVAPSAVELPPAPGPVRQQRRANVGQSRRLGLGAPLKQRDEPAHPVPAGAVAPEPPTAATAQPTQPVEDEADDEPPAPPPPEPQPPPLHHPRPTTPAPVTSDPTSPVASPSTPARPPTDPVTTSASTPTRPVTRPVATSVPLTYRAAPGRPRPAPAQAPEPKAAKPVAGYVPADLASALRGPHQVDVSSIPVHRGPEVSTEARSLGARAFTRGGEVFLPAEAGPLDTPKARGLLAHELVHAVQQRTLGPSLPAAHTPAGMALEAEAVAVEQAHSGHAGHTHAEPAPLVHPSLTQVIGQAARTVGVQLAPLHAPTLPVAADGPPTVPPAPEPVASTAPITPPVREEIDLIAESSAIRTLEEWTAPTPGEPRSAPVGPDPFANGLPSLPDTPDEAEEPALGRSQQDQAMAEQILQVINVERAAEGQPTLTTLDANTMELIRRTVAEQTQDSAARSVIFAQAAAASGVRDEPDAARPAVPAAEQAEVEAPRRAPVVVEAPAPEPATVVHTDPVDAPIEIERIDLEQLTARLYDRLRSRIRMELLIDRERAGLLTDFR